MKLFYFLALSFTMQAQSGDLLSGIYQWAKLPVKASKDKESRKILESTSAHFEFLEIHATTRSPGAIPNPPHAQADIEEVIIVKEGTMKFTIDGEEAILGPGSVVLIPPLAMQGLENIGDGPLTYYVMMFRSNKAMELERGKKAGGYLFLNADSLTFKPTGRGGRIAYFDRPTAHCENFEMHVTQLNKKGPSHAPHTHIDSEIILVIEGETEMTIDGKEYHGTSGDLYYIRSNDMHGIRNASDKPCRYFAFRWR